MNTYSNRRGELNAASGAGGKAVQLQDNRPKSIARQKQREENGTIVQLKKNNTGLPDNLKNGIENLSGYSMDDVKVHYNSAKPAQLQALAYAQGTDIHVAPGQEKHLPHEAWHIVQQKQGRVRPTLQMKAGVSGNDDKGLEKEADVMGSRSIHSSSKPEFKLSLKNILSHKTIQRTKKKKFLSKKNEDKYSKYEATEIVINKINKINVIYIEDIASYNKGKLYFGKVRKKETKGFIKSHLTDTGNNRMTKQLTVHPAKYENEKGLFLVYIIENAEKDFEEKKESEIGIRFKKAGTEFSIDMRADKDNFLIKNSNEYISLTDSDKKNYRNIEGTTDQYQHISASGRDKKQLERMFKENSDKLPLKIARGVSIYNNPKRGKKPWNVSATKIGRSQLVDKNNTDYEWCHLIGHGDGGTEQIHNFVIGTKAVNTEQLGLEKMVREWRNKFSAIKKRLRLKVSVLLRNPNTTMGNLTDPSYNVAEAIKYEVQVVQKNYDATQIPVYTHYMDALRNKISIKEIHVYMDHLNGKLEEIYNRLTSTQGNKNQNPNSSVTKVNASFLTPKNSPTRGQFSSHPRLQAATPEGKHTTATFKSSESEVEENYNKEMKSAEVVKKMYQSALFKDNPKELTSKEYQLEFEFSSPKKYLIGEREALAEELRNLEFTDNQANWILNQIENSNNSSGSWQNIKSKLKNLDEVKKSTVKINAKNLAKKMVKIERKVK